MSRSRLNEGEARLPRVAKHSATTTAKAVDTTVAKLVDDAGPPGIAKYSATTAATAVDTAGAKSAVEARLPGIEKYGTTNRVQQQGVEPDALEMVFLAGDWWNAQTEGGREKLAAEGGFSVQQSLSRLNEGEARPPGFAKYSARQPLTLLPNQSQSRLLKLGLQGLRRKAPRQFSSVAPKFAKSVGETWRPGISKNSATTAASGCRPNSREGCWSSASWPCKVQGHDSFRTDRFLQRVVEHDSGCPFPV